MSAFSLRHNHDSGDGSPTVSLLFDGRYLGSFTGEELAQLRDQLQNRTTGSAVVARQVRGATPHHGGHLDVDHDHETGFVRGIICNGCNRALVAMRDDPDRLRKAAEYLSAYRCDLHPHVKMRCPACAGAKGGKVSSPRKTAAVRENARRATEARLAREAERKNKSTPATEQRKRPRGPHDAPGTPAKEKTP